MPSFGPVFIKICTYCPWPVKIWVNGHEWAKQQARKAGPGFTQLSNGFAACDDPAVLQTICDALQPGTIEVFFQRWLRRLPLPLGTADQHAGCWWELSMARPRSPAPWCSPSPAMRAASSRRWSATTSTSAAPTPSRSSSAAGVRQAHRGTFKTQVITRGTEVTINAFYKHATIKQYHNCDMKSHAVSEYVDRRFGSMSKT